ncbi:hypothetical protein NDU88_000175 [Pleurodeles waltl]|uniref:Uncharacterized protein n=1 Tax=Pleurodeles waltl TaxID=8319 RepID=A0AAV7UR34_PLEWA|nr:hypothetical protein NDU88_000175 [Pleurodeles waltl]
MRKLQGVVRKVDKSCIGIVERLTDLEIRAADLESDVTGLQGQVESHESQLISIQWKLEDQESQQWSNNLQELGVLWGKEGSDVHLFMVDLFRQLFPQLQGWNWAQEIQCAHRVPIVEKHSCREDGKEQAILIYTGNFL